ncbi:MAG: hypothetical protein WKG06_16745 [Segetibacter sp.]
MLLKISRPYLALSSDVLSTPIAAADALFKVAPDYLPKPLKLMPPPPAALDIVAEELAKKKQIVIVIGRRAVNCGEAIELLVQKLGAPIITSLDGKGIVDETNPYVLGVLGIFGLPAVESTKQIISQADTVLAFGVDTPKTFLTDSDNVQRRELIECEPDFGSISLEYRRSRTLVGPLKAIAEGLVARVTAKPENPLIQSLAAEKNEHLRISLKTWRIVKRANTFIRLPFSHSLTTF